MSEYTDLNTIISLRKRQQLLSSPLNRLEIISPYSNSNFSQYQLDMKRKVQILKYENDFNKPTKKELWARLNNNNNNENFTLRTIDVLYDKNSNSFFTFVTPPYLDYTGEPSPTAIDYTLSRNSDIPGLNIPLYDEPSIPLYMYKSNRVYGIEQSTDVINMQYLYNRDYFIPQSTSTEFYTHFISQVAHNNDFELFEANIPFSFYYHAMTTTEVNNINLPNISVIVQSIDYTVTFNGNPVSTNHSINIINPNIEESDLGVGKFSFDISMNPIVNNRVDIFKYLGIIRISNIDLPISNGFIYDMKLSVTYNIEPPDKSTFREFIPSTDEIFGTYVFPSNDNLLFFNNASSNNINSNIYSVNTNLIITSNIPETTSINRIINDVEIIEIPVIPTSFLNIQHIFLTQYVKLFVDKFQRYVLRNTTPIDSTNFTVSTEPFVPGRKYLLTNGIYYFMGINENYYNTKEFEDFSLNIGRYWGKEIDEFSPIKPSWGDSGFPNINNNVSDLELAVSMESCLSKTSNNFGNRDGWITSSESRDEYSYKVLKKISAEQCQLLAPNLRGNCLQSYLLEVYDWGGGSMSFNTLQVFGLFEMLDNKQYIFPLKKFTSKDDEEFKSLFKLKL